MAQEQKQLLERIESYLDHQHYDSLKKLLEEQRTSDIAEVIEILDSEKRRIIFDLLEKATSAEVLEKVDEGTRNSLFEILEDTELADLVAELDLDDAVDVLSEMDPEDSETVLESIPYPDAYQIKKLMQYSEDSAGGIMDPVLVSVPEDATVSEAVDEIRQAEIDEDFYSVFVVNRLNQFLGDVRVRELITNRADTKIKQLIDTDTIFVKTDTDQEEVRNIFKKNDLIVVPVLDEKDRLVGRITADRVIEVAEEEAAEDIYTMAGTDASELESYSIIHAARIRMTWLLPCLIGTGVTAVVMFLFKNQFFASNLTILHSIIVAFVPMIAAISGNAGLQTSAIVVAGLATGDLAALNLSQVFAREVRIAVLVALCCGVIGGLICGILVDSDVISNKTATMPTHLTNLVNTAQIAISFIIAMFVAIMVSTTLGLFLPFLFRRIGIDPAIASGPLVTTANDSISVAIYLSLTLLTVQIPFFQ